MSTLEVVASAAAVLSVTAVAWLYSQQRRQHRLFDHHIEWIEEALESITEEAGRKREHTNAVARTDVAATFEQLLSLTENQPGKLVSDVEEMQRVWTELDTLLDEFGGNLPSDESQLMNLKKRAIKMAQRIDELADQVRKELD